MANSILDKIKQIINESQDSNVDSNTELNEAAQEILTGPGVEDSKKAQNATSAGQAKLKDMNASAASGDTGTLKDSQKSAKPTASLPGTKSVSEAKKDEDEDDDKDTKKKSSDDDSEDEDEKTVKEAKDDSEEDEDEDSEEDDAEDKAEAKKKKKVEEEAAIQEHINALFSGDTTLTEEFKTKAKTIFEAALQERENYIREELTEEYENDVAAAVADNLNNIVEQLDQYLDYVAEEWLKENKLESESGLRSEIAESFILGLKNLFVEHNIEVPEESVNVYEELTARVEELESKLNEELNKNIALSNQLSEQSKKDIVSTYFDGLSVAQVDKFKKLAEDIAFTTLDEYKSKLQTIKESYFTKKISAPATKKVDDLTPDESGNTAPEYSTEEMRVLVENLNRFKK